MMRGISSELSERRNGSMTNSRETKLEKALKEIKALLTQHINGERMIFANEIFEIIDKAVKNDYL